MCHDETRQAGDPLLHWEDRDTGDVVHVLDEVGSVDRITSATTVIQNRTTSDFYFRTWVKALQSLQN